MTSDTTFYHGVTNNDCFIGPVDNLNPDNVILDRRITKGTSLIVINSGMIKHNQHYDNAIHPELGLIWINRNWISRIDEVRDENLNQSLLDWIVRNE